MAVIEKRDHYLVLGQHFPQFTPFYYLFQSLHWLMNSIKGSALLVWDFMTQLVEPCSADAEATSSNPVEAPEIFFSRHLLRASVLGLSRLTAITRDALSSDCFCFLQAIFTVTLGPFAFFNVQKTKYLQIFTSGMRWIGEW